MASPTKENYIKAIFHLHKKNPNISLADIGEELEVSKSTANNMIKKLKAKDIVFYEKYKPIKITEKGKQMAAEIIRRHRLSEMFLTQIMGFGWEEVHEIAEELEHINPVKFFDRMDEMLGYPKTDPHGSPIPDKKGNFSQKNYILLADAKERIHYQIKMLKDSSSEFLVFLNEKGIQLDTHLYILDIEKFDGNITIQLEDKKEVVISALAANHLWVEEITA